MKKLITSLASVFFAMSVFAFGSSSLELKLNDYGHYTIVVNGQPYTAHNGVLVLDQMMPGQYDLVVLKHNAQRHVPRSRRVVYRGGVYVPNHTRVVGVMNGFRMRFRHRPPRHAVDPYAAAPVYHSDVIAPMHPPAFRGLIEAMRSTAFDRTRLDIARSALVRNYFSSQQIAQLMRQLSFDNKRLDLAKIAYDRCIDPENYFLLTQEFTFDSNARALMRYIH